MHGHWLSINSQASFVLRINVTKQMLTFAYSIRRWCVFSRRALIQRRNCCRWSRTSISSTGGCLSWCCCLWLQTGRVSSLPHSFSLFRRMPCHVRWDGWRLDGWLSSPARRPTFMRYNLSWTRYPLSQLLVNDINNVEIGSQQYNKLHYI